MDFVVQIKIREEESHINEEESHINEEESHINEEDIKRRYKGFAHKEQRSP